MRIALRLAVAVVLTLALLPGAASATHLPDQSRNMDELFEDGNQATNSDLAFWGDHAFVGYYTGDAGFPTGTGPRGGGRIYDISNPDNPRRPFRSIEQVDTVYTDCGAHTITLWPEFADDRRNPRLLVYVSSYPLRAGPTCGDTEYQNTANPYDEDRGSPANPLHGVIQVVEVPVDNPEDSRELRGAGGQTVQPAISYRTDPDGRIEWCERGFDFGFCNLANFEPAAVACHDIVVHVEHRVAGGACAEDGQVWEIDENGIPDTANPMSVGDDKVSSGGTGQFPGAIDFFHSVMFDNEAETVNWVDESFGSGCPTMTTYQPRPHNPAGGVHKTGREFFSDIEGNFQSEFHVGDVRPDPRPLEYCSAHMGMAVMGIERDLLVNAWYTGGVDVIDFTNPTRLREIAYYDPQRDSGTWSAYPYTGPTFRRGPGTPVYASDGVTNNAQAEGMVVYRTLIEQANRRNRVDHLNPQTMDHEMDGRGGGDGRGDDDDDDDDRGGGGRGDDDDDDDRGNGRGRDRDRDDRGNGRGDDDDDDDRGRGRGRDRDRDDDDD